MSSWKDAKQVVAVLAWLSFFSGFVVGASVLCVVVLVVTDCSGGTVVVGSG